MDRRILRYSREIQRMPGGDVGEEFGKGFFVGGGGFVLGSGLKKKKKKMGGSDFNVTHGLRQG